MMRPGIAYLGDPTADRLERLGLSRTASVAIVFSGIVVAILLLLILLAPMLYAQSIALIHNIPAWINWILDTRLTKLGISLPQGTHLDADGLHQIVSRSEERRVGKEGVSTCRYRRLP